MPRKRSPITMPCTSLNTGRSDEVPTSKVRHVVEHGCGRVLTRPHSDTRVACPIRPSVYNCPGSGSVYEGLCIARARRASIAATINRDSSAGFCKCCGMTNGGFQKNRTRRDITRRVRHFWRVFRTRRGRAGCDFVLFLELLINRRNDKLGSEHLSGVHGIRIGGRVAPSRVDIRLHFILSADVLVGWEYRF